MGCRHFTTHMSEKKITMQFDYCCIFAKCNYALHSSWSVIFLGTRFISQKRQRSCMLFGTSQEMSEACPEGIYPSVHTRHTLTHSARD